ncbi:hypothetical protein D9M71_153560 [compost metagenome]
MLAALATGVEADVEQCQVELHGMTAVAAVQAGLRHGDLGQSLQGVAFAEVVDPAVALGRRQPGAALRRQGAQGGGIRAGRQQVIGLRPLLAGPLQPRRSAGRQLVGKPGADLQAAQSIEGEQRHLPGLPRQCAGAAPQQQPGVGQRAGGEQRGEALALQAARQRGELPAGLEQGKAVDLAAQAVERRSHRPAMAEQAARQGFQALAGGCRRAATRSHERRVLTGGQSLMHQRRRAGRVEILGHLLAAGQVVQAQVVAYQDIQHRAEPGGLVALGDDAVVQAATGGAGGTLVGSDHLFQGVAVAGGVEQQHQAHRMAGTAELGDLADQALVALAHTDGVDDHQALAGQLSQHAVQCGLGGQRLHLDAEQAAIDAQLLVGTDPVAVGAEQGDLAAAVAHHVARRQLGGGGGLAGAVGADQRQHAALVEQIVLVGRHRQARSQLALQPGASGRVVDRGVLQLGRQRGEDLVAQVGAEAGQKQHLTQAPGPAVRAGGRGDLPVEQFAHALHLAEQQLAQRREVHRGRLRGWRRGFLLGALVGSGALGGKACRRQRRWLAHAGGHGRRSRLLLGLRWTRRQGWRRGRSGRLGHQPLVLVVGHGEDLHALGNRPVGQDQGILAQRRTHLAHGVAAVGSDKTSDTH